MKGIRYTTLLVVMLVTLVTMCSSCPNGVGIGGGGGNYETQGVYHNGKLMTGVQDEGFESTAGWGDWRKNDEIQAAWQRHKNSAKTMRRKFILDIYPSMSPLGTGNTYPIDASNKVTYNILADKKVGNKMIGQVEIILQGNGGYIIWDFYRPGTYILIKH